MGKLTEPKSMDEILYYTFRSLGDHEEGSIVCWVNKLPCPKCKKALMGKPRDKSGKVKIRATEYVCPSCGNSAEKKAYEETLFAEANYICPSCKKQGCGKIPYKRKSIDGVPTLRFSCEFCKVNLDVTKKMKSKKGKSDDSGDDD
jgi:hypothetical protein